MTEDPSPSGKRSAAELMAGMMRKELYLIRNKCLGNPASLQAELEAHLRYMIDLEKTGVLFASGPLFDQHGNVTGDGVTIVRASSFADAHAVASKDPFVLAGLRQPEIHRWIVNEGRITLTVDLSDRNAQLP
jgi:uncharacterized protein YciI